MKIQTARRYLHSAHRLQAYHPGSVRHLQAYIRTLSVIGWLTVSRQRVAVGRSALPIDGFSVLSGSCGAAALHRLDGFDIKLLRGYSQAADRNFWKFTGVRDCAGQNRTGEQ